MILPIIQQLAATSSSLEKLAILEKNKDNEFLREFFRLSLSPYIQFHIRKIPSYSSNGSDRLTVSSLQLTGMHLSTRKVTGNAAINYLSDVLSGLHADDAKVLELMIKKDPNCGVAESTVNKVWPNLIPTHPVLLASSYDEKLFNEFNWDAGVIMQIKSDGVRANVIITDTETIVLSRNGKPIHVLGVFDHFRDIFGSNVVIDGEIVTPGLDRQTGNGIVNKANKGTITEDEASKLMLIAWDIISYDDFLSQQKTNDGMLRSKRAIPYKERFSQLIKSISESNMASNIPIKGCQRELSIINGSSEFELLPNVSAPFIASASTIILYDKVQANKLYNQLVLMGEEGAIIKDQDMLWEDERSKKQMKMKTVFDIDLICTGVKPHSKKPNMIGALELTTSDGILEVNAGSGLSKRQQLDYFINSPVGKIFKIEYNQGSKDRSGKISLFLPIIVEERFDKDTADSIQSIQFINKQSEV